MSDRTITVHVFRHRLIIEGGQQLLRWANSYYKKKLRRFEKNNFPLKCDCTICGERFECRSIKECVDRQGICWGCSFENKIKIAAKTLYHLICAIPQQERDREEIYPADFSTALIPLPLRTNWQADKLARWKRQGWLLCGVSSRAALGLDGLHLRDYAGPARLLTKFGKYELVARQKAASPARYVLAVAPAFVVSPETQQVLKRIGRLYKNSCWWSEKGKRRLFDKAEASSWKKAQLWKPGQRSFELDPTNAGPDFDPLDLIAKREIQQIRREGGRVLVILPDSLGEPFWLISHKRNANLASTRAAYNERYESYLNSAGLGKTLRLRGSLNIPRENYCDQRDRTPSISSPQFAGPGFGQDCIGTP